MSGTLKVVEAAKAKIKKLVYAHLQAITNLKKLQPLKKIKLI